MTLVVKIGGGANITSVTTEHIIHEIAQCVAEGQRIVVVHGGSALTNTLSERLGQPVRMITSPSGMVSRYTDSETLRIFAMAVAGEINTSLVACLQQHGVNALGLTGVDGRLLLARRKPVVRTVTPEGRTQLIRDDYTGQIEQVNTALLQQLLAAGYTPVIAPLALSREGERLNVDGDRVAAAVAVALQAETMVIMTNVPGLLTDPGDNTTLIQTIPAEELTAYMGYAQGRMRKKLLGAQEALQGGVPRVHIGSTSLLDVLNGKGTTIATKAREACVGTGGRGAVAAGALCLSWWGSRNFHEDEDKHEAPASATTSTPCPYNTPPQDEAPVSCSHTPPQLHERMSI